MGCNKEVVKYINNNVLQKAPKLTSLLFFVYFRIFVDLQENSRKCTTTKEINY